MPFVNQRLAVLGLGEEALDLLDYLKLTAKNCRIAVFDQKDRQQLEDRLKRLTMPVELHLGKNYLKKGLTGFDLIFRSPGFYRFHPALIKAEKASVAVSSATKLFFELCPCPIIGVTGTKGKGTTISLIRQILTASGKKAHLAGNIGKPMLSLLPQLKADHWVCLELSSFQLQDLTVSPKLAVVLNISREHQDVHRSVKEYRQAKLNLVNYQSAKDFCVVNADYPASRRFAAKTPAQVYWFSRRRPVPGAFVTNQQIWLQLNHRNYLIGSTAKLKLKGQHNWENVTAAVIASHLAGSSLKAIKKAVFSFKGLEHRLELVAGVKGVKFYNDSFSTTPETAMAAIKAFNVPMILILGGSEKGSDYSQLGRVIHQSSRLKALILVGRMAKKIEAAINKAGGFQGKVSRRLATMTQIVNLAFQLADRGEVVVLSPACASFDMFQNYKDRGIQFKKAVKTLVKNA